MSIARFVDTDQLAIMRGLCDFTNAVYVTLHTGAEVATHSYVNRIIGWDDGNDLSPDATPTGVGDPLAGVLRSIDELLEGQ